MAAWLLVPYLLWVLYAISLNAGIAVLNSNLGPLWPDFAFLSGREFGDMVLLLTLARVACGRDRGFMGANEAKDATAMQRFQNRPPGRQGEGVRASDDGEPTASGPRQPTDGLHDLGSQTSLETAARVGREFRRSIDPVHADEATQDNVPLPVISRGQMADDWQMPYPVLCIAGRSALDEAASIMLAQVSGEARGSGMGTAVCRCCHHKRLQGPCHRLWRVNLGETGGGDLDGMRRPIAGS
jgi:hypothetical protein